MKKNTNFLVIVKKSFLIVDVIKKKNGAVINKRRTKFVLGQLNRELDAHLDSKEIITVHRATACPSRNFCLKKMGQRLSCRFCPKHHRESISQFEKPKPKFQKAEFRFGFLFFEKELPYSLWLECQVGNPLNRKGKIRIYKDEIPFKIGLIDKRQPKKPSG